MPAIPLFPGCAKEFGLAAVGEPVAPEPTELPPPTNDELLPTKEELLPTKEEEAAVAAFCPA